MLNKKRYEIVYSDAFILILITLSMLVSFVLSLFKQYILSGLIFIFISLFSFTYYYKKTKNYLNCRGVFFLFWLFAIGLSAMKIHPLQTAWKIETWFALWFSVCFFIVGYNLAFFRRVKNTHIKGFGMSAFQAICSLAVIILCAFIIEIVHCGFIPLFSSSMSAYQDFAMPIIHYVTVSCVLLPPITIVEYKQGSFTKKQLYTLIFLNFLMLLIPALIVSRQLFIMGIFILFFTFLELRNTSIMPKKTIAVFILLIFVVWFFLSLKRNQNDSYLRQVLMLDNKMSVSVYRDYLYIAFNIDNFNNIVGRLGSYSLFNNSLAPLVTFTGTSGIMTKLFSSSLPPALLPTFTTYSFLIAPYQDLGLVGVALYCIAIGMFSGMNERKESNNLSPKLIVYHVISNFCLAFSFFAPFFSNTSIWGYFIVVFIYDSLTWRSRGRP